MKLDDLLKEKGLAGAMHYAADMISYAERIMQLPTCNECVRKRECQYLPDWGAMVRINCPLYRGKDEEG